MGGGQKGAGREKRKRARSKATDRTTSFHDDSDDDAESKSYFAMGSGDAQLRKALSMMMRGEGGSFAASIEHGLSGDATLTACQNCGDVSARMKRLQCSHVICRKCAMRLRSEHLDPGE